MKIYVKEFYKTLFLCYNQNGDNMKKLLATFSYLDNFYELYADKDGKTSVVLFGKNKNKTDNEMICKKVIDKINELRNEYSYRIDFKGEEIDVYYDRIVDLYYFKKDGIRINEDNKEYIDLYKMYNYLPSYYYDNRHRPSNSRNSSSYRPYNATPNSQYQRNDYNYKRRLENQKKKLKIIVGSITLSVTLLVGAFVAVPKIIDAKDSTQVESSTIVEDTLGEIEDTPFIIYEDSQEQTIEDQIIKSIISNCGEQPDWVYEQVIEDYKLSIQREEKYDELLEAMKNGASQEEIDRIEEEIDASSKDIEENNIDTSKATKRTNRMIEAISSNKNISEEDKNVLINGMFNTMQKDSGYYTDENFEEILGLLSTFNIDKKYLEKNEPHRLSDGFLSAGECSPDRTLITIYTDANYESTLCHELQHILGKTIEKTHAYNKIDEGMTETYCDSNTTYGLERCFYIMLEQIYGESFFKSAYYNNENLFWAFQEKFGIEQARSNYDLCVKINGFLIDYQLENDMTKLQENSTYKEEVNGIINDLMKKYNEVTGLEWDSNNVLSACGSYLTGMNKTLPDNLSVTGIKKGLDGKYYLQVGGSVNYSYEVVNGPNKGTIQAASLIEHDELIR